MNTNERVPRRVQLNSCGSSCVIFQIAIFDGEGVGLDDLLTISWVGVNIYL